MLQPGRPDTGRGCSLYIPIKGERKMNTSVEDDERVDKPEGAEPCCDSTCSCHARGLSTGAKTAICLLVALAAVVVVLLGSANKARTAGWTDAFATAAVASAPIAAPA